MLKIEKKSEDQIGYGIDALGADYRDRPVLPKPYRLQDRAWGCLEQGRPFPWLDRPRANPAAGRHFIYRQAEAGCRWQARG